MPGKQIDREKRRGMAVEHNKHIMQKYRPQIMESILSTRCYTRYTLQEFEPGIGSPTIRLIPTDTVSALFECGEDAGRIAVLNFASYKNPGGGYIGGSIAQEEALCHASTLYPVLKQNVTFYNYNNQNTRSAMYEDRALYSPGIVFEKEGSEITADVITCAAPNLRTAEKYHGQKMATRNYYTLENRIRFLRKICEKENIHTFIFGAWGCGVFGQDAKDVAFLFLKEFENADIAEIIIAIPPGENFDKFEARYMTVPEWQQL